MDSRTCRLIVLAFADPNGYSCNLPYLSGIIYLDDKERAG